MFILMASIGDILSGSTIRRRDLVKIPQVYKLVGIFPILTDDVCVQVKEVFKTSGFITSRMLPHWNDAVEYYLKER